MPADILDVFADRASPRLRKERPALIAARVRWASVRVATERDVLCGQAVRSVQGVGVGDQVHIELTPNLHVLAVVIEWKREDPLPGAQLAPLLARCRLEADALPWRAGEIVKRTRNRLWPVPPKGAVS